MISDTSERRIKPRVEIDGVMTYRTDDSSETHPGRLENLSDRGACIWIRQELPTSSRLHCRIESDIREEGAMEFRATLLHALPEQRDSLFGYGCTIEVAQLLDSYKLVES